MRGGECARPRLSISDIGECGNFMVCIENDQLLGAPIYLITVDHVLLAGQIAKRLEGGEDLLILFATVSVLNDTLRSRPNEKHIALLDLLRLVGNPDAALAARADQDTGSSKSIKGGLGSGAIEVCLNHAELLDRRVVEDAR